MQIEAGAFSDSVDIVFHGPAVIMIDAGVFPGDGLAAFGGPFETVAGGVHVVIAFEAVSVWIDIIERAFFRADEAFDQMLVVEVF